MDFPFTILIVAILLIAAALMVDKGLQILADVGDAIMKANDQPDDEMTN